MARKTHEQFVEEVQALVGDEYTVMTEYKASQEKVEIRHSVCGKVFHMTPNRFLMGNRCPPCAGKERKTTEQFAAEVLDLGQGEYELISEYVSCHTKVTVRHLACGSDYQVKPNCFLSGRRCPVCNGSFRLSPEQIQERITVRHGPGYRALGNYSGINAPITIEHIDCGRIFTASSLQNFLRAERPCPVCHDRIRDTEWLRKRIARETDGDYELTGAYTGYTSKTAVRHIACGHEYEVTPNHFFGMKTRCPICVRQQRDSRAVRTIETFLNERNISYVREKHFEDCKLARTLPFDFFVESDGLLIEFDGEQHFKPKFGKNTFQKQQQRDELKTTWAEKNGLRLLRISYLEEARISDILSKTFND